MSPASRTLRDSRGFVTAELALVAPIFFLIALATADLVALLRAQLRTETIAVQLGQIVSQCRTISNPGDRDVFWAHAGRIAAGVIDVNSPTGGAVVVSAVARSGNANVLSWQMRTGNTSHTSSVGATVGGAATLRGNQANTFVMPANQTLMVTEVFSIVRPWVLSAGLIGTVLPSTIQDATLFLSRAPDPTTLQTAPRNSNIPECTA